MNNYINGILCALRLCNKIINKYDNSILAIRKICALYNHFTYTKYKNKAQIFKYIQINILNK